MQAFRYYDVITSLSTGASPLQSLDRLHPLSLLPSGPSPLDNVDTLLGAATDLWPILYRLCDLISLKRDLDQATASCQGSKVAVLRAEYEATCAAINYALNKWEPCLKLCFDDDPTTEASKRSILGNALAYRHSALVYLHRTILERPREDEVVQRHVHMSLLQCLVVVASGGPVSALLWPLFVAACEAQTGVDRGLARQAFLAIESRQGMANIEKARAVVMEVWRRVDLLVCDITTNGVSANLWRVVAEETGLSLVLG